MCLADILQWFKQCFWRKKPDVEKEPYFCIND